MCYLIVLQEIKASRDNAMFLMNIINWIDFGTLVRECAGTAVGLHPQYRVFIAEVTSLLMADTTGDWKTNVRHVVDVIFQHIDKVIIPQWVQVAVEDLDGDKLTVPAELVATFPLIHESQNLDGFYSVVGSDKQELYRLNREALLQFVCLRVSWVWHALHEISPASCPTKLDLSGNLPKLASVETICEDTSSCAIFWSGLWNLVTTTDWTTTDFSTTLPVLVDSALAMLPNHSKQAPSLAPPSVAELPAAQSSEAALPTTQSSDAGPNTPMSLLTLHKCFKTISDTPNVLKTHTHTAPARKVGGPQESCRV